jgi:beta-galactosidase
VTVLAQRIEALTREADPYRYTMIPNHGSMQRYQEARLTEIPMIVGWNLYQGWYGGKFSGFGEFLDQHREVLPHKPVIVTEYGGGADPRIRTTEPRRFDFSMEWNNRLHEAYLAAVQERPFVTGALVWNFADFHSESRLDSEPHINSKGLMTLDRQPKDTYLYYQAQLAETPMVAFANQLWPERAGIADSGQALHATQELTVFSNLTEVELFQNGRSLGKQAVKAGKTQWPVAFTNGRHRLRAVGQGAEATAEDFLDLEFTLISRQLTEAASPLPDICVNVGGHFAYLEEPAGQVWLPDQPYRPGSWGYLGGEPYFSKRHRVGSAVDILGTDDNPLFQTQRVGLQGYRFDLPPGDYEVSLYLAELLTEEQLQALPYELVAGGEQAVAEVPLKQRVFSVSQHATPLVENLNLAQMVGPQRAMVQTFLLTVNPGEALELRFEAIQGEAVLNALRIHPR